MLLIGGGARDPNIVLLERRTVEKKIPAKVLLQSPGGSPPFSWNMTNDKLEVEGEEITPESMFIRYDVFNQGIENQPDSPFKAFGWYSSVMGWALAHPEVRLFNRNLAVAATNKLFVLNLARLTGLEIPSSLVSNEIGRISQTRTHFPLVAKPAGGGGYCVEFTNPQNGEHPPTLIGSTPAIVQEQLVPPEVRIYLVGKSLFAFQIEATTLDYRLCEQCAVTEISTETLPVSLRERLLELAARLSLDFAAADFKTCPQTGELLFLEINNQPMFAAFDQVCEQKISNAIIDYLTQNPDGK